jgi:hypothetical protein
MLHWLGISWLWCSIGITVRIEPFMDCMRPEKGFSVQDRHTEAERLQEIRARPRSVQDRLMIHLSRVGTSAPDAGLK